MRCSSSILSSFYLLHPRSSLLLGTAASILLQVVRSFILWRISALFLLYGLARCSSQLCQSSSKSYVPLFLIQQIYSAVFAVRPFLSCNLTHPPALPSAILRRDLR
ncbi:hypothetical protein M413DRAFT_345941 [Hebeloma cylindrosporum]|uniref:Uncharacterized protein n=1 Tax=Hebeloma cylindrosporum TaxID=76867 RepID=A0A0C2Y797_HEBCY|nr:hypothetical protein M413DRAFT_345941 [Hebeloma cylindrosporum h7]